MKQLKIIFGWVGKFWFIYLIHAVIITVLALTRTVVPQFISYGIDSLLGSEGSPLPKVFSNIIESQVTVRDSIITLVLLLIAFQVCRAVLMLLSRFVYSLGSESAIFQIRNMVFSHLQRLPYSFFKTRKTGDIIQRCSTDLDVVRSFLSEEVPQLIWIVAMISMLIYQMLNIDVMFGVISLLIFPAIFIVSIYYQRILKSSFMNIDECEGEMINVIKENVSGVQVVKAFGGQNFEFKKYDNQSNTYYSEISDVLRVLAQFVGVNKFMYGFQIVVIVVSGIFLVNKGEITIGTLILFLTYVKIMSYPVRMLARIITRMGRNFVAIDRVNEILEEPVEVINDVKSVVNGDIEFRDVVFKYPDGEENILDGISFKIKTGEKVAIIGPTGCGKSTISHLLARMFEPTSGEIYINGVDISTINQKHLRNEVGIVVQEPYLFSKKISENIAIKNQEYKYDEIESVAKVARIHEDITEFESGYETEIGERGTTLSGGQKQRVAIARMLINDHKVFVFDDSLSAVDNDTDRAIRNAINDIPSTTTINITHRITSILDCNHIIALDNGKVVEEGTIEELLKNKNGYFYDVYTKQVGDFNE